MYLQEFVTSWILGKKQQELWDSDIPSLADQLEGDTTPPQYLHIVFIPLLFPPLPMWTHVASTVVRYTQLFPNAVSDFYSQHLSF